MFFLSFSSVLGLIWMVMYLYIKKQGTVSQEVATAVGAMGAVLAGFQAYVLNR